MKTLDALWLDARMAARGLRKNRGTTVLAMLSIALGVGLTTALFSVADAIVFRPYPFSRPAELHAVRSIGDDGRSIGFGWLDYEDMARAAAGTAELAAVNRHGLMLAGELTSELVLSYSVTGNFFALLGVRAELGRAEVAPTGDGQPQVVLSHRFWQRHFGGDRAALGQTLVFNGVPCVVAGVLPAAVTGIIRGVPCDVFIGAEAWFQARRDPRARQSRTGDFELLLRAPEGTAPEPLAARLDAAIRGEGAHKPAPAGAPGTALASPFTLDLREKLTLGGGVFAALALLLFVACANAAQLRLAQAESRKKEMGVRLALGCGRGRLARLLLLETLGLSVGGAALAGVLLLGGCSAAGGGPSPSSLAASGQTSDPTTGSTVPDGSSGTTTSSAARSGSRTASPGSSTARSHSSAVGGTATSPGTTHSTAPGRSSSRSTSSGAKPPAHSSSSAPATPNLSAQLLTLSDLPSGWAAASSGSFGSDGGVQLPACFTAATMLG